MNELKLNNPQDLIAMAIEKGSGIEQLEKLMDLQERWEKKEARKSFFASMSAFQKIKPVIKKDKDADYGSGKAKYKWASLDAIQKGIDPVLSDLGLSYTFETIEDNKLTIICKVTHELGHTEQTQLSAPNDNSGGKNPIQALGSTNSYLRRYTLCNAFGISPDEDDDGEATEKKPLPGLNEKEIKSLKETLDKITNRKELDILYKGNGKYRSNADSNKLFQAKAIQISEFKKLSALYSNIDESKVDAIELMNIERIIDQKETLSYAKAITYLEKLNNGQ